MEISDMSEGSSKASPRLTWWMLLLLALVAVGVYANSVRNDFAFDDVTIVQHNERVLDLKWTEIWHTNYWPMVDGYQPDVLYRPLTIWSYLANEAMFPGKAWTFHLTNVLLHALATVMVGVLGWKIFGNRWVALVAGLLFAIHPIHAEAVANVVGRAEILAAIWSFAAVLIYLPEEPLVVGGQFASRPLWHGWLVGACFFGAMLSKETPAALLGVFVLIDVWRWYQGKNELGRPTFVSWFGGQWVRYYLPLGSVFLAYLALRSFAMTGLFGFVHPTAGVLGAVVTLGVMVVVDGIRWRVRGKEGRPALLQWLGTRAVRYYYVPVVMNLAARIHVDALTNDVRMTHPIVNPLVRATNWERVVTPFAIFAKYMALTVWPRVLSADYSAPSLMPTSNPFEPLPLAGILVISLSLLVGWKYRRQSGVLLLTMGLFGLSYALVANVLRIGTIMGERLFYLPSAFMLMIAAYGVVAAWRSGWMSEGAWKRVTAGLMLVAAGAGLFVRTAIRNTDWHDNITLAIATARDNPRSAKACYWAGSVLANDGTLPWMTEFGRQLLEQSSELCETYSDSYWELAKYWARKNDIGKATINLAHAAINNPGATDLREALACVGTDFKSHPVKDYMPTLEGYVRDHPLAPEGRLALALAYDGQEKFKEAEHQCTMALLLEAGYSEALAELAMVRMKVGKTAEGVGLLRNYVRQINHSVDARCTMVKALMKLDPKEFPTAISEAQMNLDRAAVLSPGNTEVRKLQAQLKKKEMEQDRALSSASGISGTVIGGVK